FYQRSEIAGDTWVHCLARSGLEPEPNERVGDSPPISLRERFEALNQQLGLSFSAHNEDDKEPLLLAVEHNNLDAVRVLLDLNVDADHATHGATPLIAAAERGNDVILNVLIEKLEAQPHHNGESKLNDAPYGSTALHAIACPPRGVQEALRGGRVRCVKALIEKNAAVNVFDGEGFTPLARAAQSGRLDVFRALKEGRAELGTRTRARETLLHLAARYGHAHIVDELKEYGVDTTLVDEHNRTALDTAVIHDKVDVFTRLASNEARANPALLMLAVTSNAKNVTQSLLANGVQGHVQDELGNTPLHHAVKNGHVALIAPLYRLYGESVNNNTETPLHTAASNGQRNAVIALHALGAKLDAKNVINGTPLHMAAFGGHATTVAALCEIDPEGIHRTAAHNYTPLHFAVQEGHAAAVQTLLDHGADRYALTADTVPTFHVAIHQRHIETLRVLLANCEVDHHTFASGYTPLHKAVDMDCAESINALLDHGVPLTPEYQFLTPAHFAALHNRANAFEALLNRGVDLNKKTLHGHTLLHLAANNGNLEFVENLVRRGCDIEAKDNSGRTAIDLAKSLNHDAIVAFLKSNRPERAQRTSRKSFLQKFKSAFRFNF
ncbi:MAG TPA: ankyrin repeat domain-containing protein, partial [Burkholderiaceae bacterium]|nr:ankyrin repeat domain-containing protein [Burkholderiaceae bacterium]